MTLYQQAESTGFNTIDEFESLSDLKEYLSPSSLNSLLRTNIYTQKMCQELFNYIVDNKHLWRSTRELIELDYYLI